MSTGRVRPSQAPTTHFATQKTQPEQNKISQDETEIFGTVKVVKDTYGFVEVDATEEQCLLIPSKCRDWDGELPPVGARVVFQVEPAARGRSRRLATHVRERGKLGKHGTRSARHEEEKKSRSGYEKRIRLEERSTASKDSKDTWSERDNWDNFEWRDIEPSRTFRGTMDEDCGNYGFIREDAKDGEEPQRIFVLPYSCPDSRLPPLGSRVEYSIVTDPKTGKERAEDVIPEGTGDDRPQSGWNPVPGEVYCGTVCKEAPRFCFVRHDDSSEELFLHPSDWLGFKFKLPPLGTRVKFSVDPPRRGPRKMAVNVDFEVDPREADSEVFKGVIVKNYGNYGFIKDGEEKVFLLPSSCRGREIFNEGTRVTYRKTIGKRDGKLQASDVDVDSDRRSRPETEKEQKGPQPANGLRGVLTSVKDSYGFIQVDEGKDIFVHCHRFPGHEIPKEGTELQFDSIRDGDKLAATNVTILSSYNARIPGHSESSEPPASSKEDRAEEREALPHLPRKARSYKDSYKSPEVAILWKRFCDENAQGQYDVQEHSGLFLRQFLEAVLPEDVSDAPPAKRQRTWDRRPW
eukprot:s2076_g13.t1